MEPLAGDNIPQALVRKLANYQRGPRSQPQIHRNTQPWGSHSAQSAAAAESAWAALSFAEVKIEAAAAKVRVHSSTADDTSSKYSLSHYAQHGIHQHGRSQDCSRTSHDADKITALQQETVAMQLAFAEQQSALHAFTKCKVRPGLPFTRPGMQQPKTVGAAGIVPNNRIKHPNAAPSTPDLTKDRPIVWPAHIPHPDRAKIAHADSTQRRQAAPRLHCKAFEFPAKALEVPMVPHHGKATKEEGACEVKTRPFHMLGSGFRVKTAVKFYDS